MHSHCCTFFCSHCQLSILILNASQRNCNCIWGVSIYAFPSSPPNEILFALVNCVCHHGKFV
ncbi:unnamed protein product, partial [Vitis vinifera]